MIVNKYNKGNGGGGTDYTAGQYIQIAEDVISVTGITPDLYLTTADTQDFVTEADITAATSPIQTQLDDIERVTATALTELHNDILEISGSTPDLSNYYTKAETNAAITGATQGFATEAYVEDAIQEAMTGFTPELPSYLDQEVLEAKEEVIASAITELHNEILDISGDTPDMSNYYTSAQTENAISAATSGKADAANVTGGYGIARWNSQGIVTGGIATYSKVSQINGTNYYVYSERIDIRPNIYAPTVAGTAGDILVSTGSGAPVWSAVTQDLASEEYVDSAIDAAISGVTDMMQTKEEVVSRALNDLHEDILDLSGATPDLSNYYTSAQTENAISAATANKVSSTSVTTIWRGTQAEYDAITTPDASTLYIIVNN